MPEEFGPRRKMSLWLKLLLFLGVPLSLLLAAALSVDGFGRGALNTALREARADGKPFTFEVIHATLKAWPDDQNGANVILKMAKRLEELAKSGDLDALPMFNSSPMPDLGTRLKAEDDQATGTCLERLQPELNEIDQLARYQGGRFAVTIAPMPIETLLPSYAPLRTSIKLKASQAEYRVLHGDNSQVLNDISIMLVHGRLVSGDPFLIGSLIGLACDGLTLSTIERISAFTALTPDQLEELQKRVTALEGEDRISLAIRGERASFVGTCDYLRASGRNLGDSSLPSGLLRVPGIRGVSLQDEAAGLRVLNRMVTTCGLWDRAREIADENDRRVQAMPPYYVLSRAMLPSLGRVMTLDGNHEAVIRAAKTGLAAERFRLKTGRFPTTLDELVPEFLDKVPLDPFDHKPLRYRLTADRAVIYSIGDNLKDDGGVLDSSRKSNSDRDWGFTLLAPSLRGRPASQPASEPAS